MMCLGLNYIHSEGFVHRDISSKNLFLKKKEHGEGYWLLVGDLGLARNLRDKKTEITMDSMGTLQYCAPEFFLDESPFSKDKLDSWSSGIVLYEMIAGHLPFSGNNVIELIKKQEMPEIEGISAELQSLLTGLLTKDPLQRLSINDCIWKFPII
jgi:serine/threonine protein kinase